LLPAVQAAREAARRTQCSNNLKQLGLAVQNYHDIRQEICPAWLTNDGSAAGTGTAGRAFAAWPVLLLPFMEQQNIYSLVDLSFGVDGGGAPAATITNHATVRSTSIPTYFCPSRRSPTALTTFAGATQCSVGDYAAVAWALGASSNDSAPGDTAGTGISTFNQARQFDSAMLVCRAFNSNSTAVNAAINGFQAFTLGGKDFRAMTTFASVLDGLSNTAFIGEKAVHKDRMGGGTNAATTENANNQDGPYYFVRSGTGAGNSRTAPGSIAAFMRRLAPENNNGSDRIIALKPTGDGTTANDPRFRFGSWHPGVSLFMLGDGSVRQVSNSTSNIALQRFGTRNDRFTFDLP
jgi:hypothetical protein